MAAPTPGSAYLHSATMVKAGVFLLARLYPALSHSDEWFWLVSLTGPDDADRRAYLRSSSMTSRACSPIRRSAIWD